MQLKLNHIFISTKGNNDIIDITSQVKDIIQSCGLKDGQVTIFCPSSTSGVTTIEYEPGVLHDLQNIFDEIAPRDRQYLHDEAWHDGNGHSHIRAALLKPSLTVPVSGGRMTLGTWQQIVFIDFDNRPRKREIIVQALGD
jgi:secondary thiamine-phosphate synthase enzyme